MHLGRDPIAVLDTRNGFDALLTRLLVDEAEELRREHTDELAARIAEALGGKG
jgi:hypothetical protein